MSCPTFPSVDYKHVSSLVIASLLAIHMNFPSIILVPHLTPPFVFSISITLHPLPNHGFLFGIINLQLCHLSKFRLFFMSIIMCPNGYSLVHFFNHHWTILCLYPNKLRYLFCFGWIFEQKHKLHKLEPDNGHVHHGTYIVFTMTKRRQSSWSKQNLSKSKVDPCLQYIGECLI